MYIFFPLSHLDQGPIASARRLQASLSYSTSAASVHSRSASPRIASGVVCPNYVLSLIFIWPGLVAMPVVGSPRGGDAALCTPADGLLETADIQHPQDNACDTWCFHLRPGLPRRIRPVLADAGQCHAGGSEPQGGTQICKYLSNFSCFCFIFYSSTLCFGDSTYSFIRYVKDVSLFICFFSRMSCNFNPTC